MRSDSHQNINSLNVVYDDKNIDRFVWFILVHRDKEI